MSDSLSLSLRSDCQKLNFFSFNKSPASPRMPTWPKVQIETLWNDNVAKVI